MSVERLKRDFLSAAQKYKKLFKENANPDDLDSFNRLMDVYIHLDDIADDEIQDLQSVTDEGNTTTNTIDTAGTTSDYFLLDTGATPTPQQGMLFWDADRQTAGLQMNGVEARLGQDNFWYVKNQSGSDILKGTAVMAVGALGASSRILVAPMVADGSVDAIYLLGITAEDILSGEDGFVMNIGKIRGIDTSQYGTQAGQVLYCDPSNPGGFTITQPDAPNLDIPIAFTVDYKSNGTIAVRVNPGYKIGELHDVYSNSPANNDILLYNSATTRWENTPLATAVPTPTLQQVTTAGNTTTNNISVGTLTSKKTEVDFTPTSDTIALDIRGTGTPNDYFTVSNATGGANDVFLPIFFYKAATYGYNGGTNRYPSGVYGGGFIAAVDDTSYPSAAGAGAAMHFNSRAYANNGPLSNRYLFSWGSWLTTHMAMTAGGNLLIGKTTDSGEKLQINGSADVSGNINADGDFYQNGTQGYTGTITIDQSFSGLPPINIDVQGGIITNVT